MLHDPDILFLDEPTLGVDVQSRNAIHEYIKELPRKGKTVVLTTNYMEEAQKLADRVVVLDSHVVVGPDSIDTITRTAIPETIFDFTIKQETIPEGFRELFIRDAISGEIMREEPILEDTKFHVKVPNSRVESILDNFLSYCHENNILIQDLTVSKPTIEDAFLQLTGKGLRD
jgi:ABC-2 type transport system ATP-binding protein